MILKKSPSKLQEVYYTVYFGSQPDASINQSFTISITVDNDETLNVETSNFEVSN